MFISQSALKKYNVRRAKRPIRRKLNTCPLDEGTGSHDDGIGISRHRTGLRDDMGIHRRSFLDRPTKFNHPSGILKNYGLDNIGPFLPGTRTGLKAEMFKQCRRKQGSLHGLGNNMGCDEQPLVHVGQSIQSCSPLKANAGCG